MMTLRISQKLAIGLTLCLVSNGSGQVIVNPGFETGTFEGWETLLSGPPGYASAEIVSSEPRLGAFAASLSAVGNSGAGALVSQTFSPIPVSQIQLFSLYAARFGQAGVQIDYTTNGPQFLTALPGQWSYVDVLSQLDSARSIYRIVFYAFGDVTGGGSIRFDAVALTLQTPCPGDLDDDGSVGLADLALLLSEFGCHGGANPCAHDIDGDGYVDLSDLATVLADFGSVCP